MPIKALPKEPTKEQINEWIINATEHIQTLETDIENYKTNLETKETRVKELENANQKLFLRITEKTNLINEDKEDEEFNSKLLGDYANLLDDEELEILKELEGEL